MALFLNFFFFFRSILTGNLSITISQSITTVCKMDLCRIFFTWNSIRFSQRFMRWIRHQFFVVAVKFNFCYFIFSSSSIFGSFKKHVAPLKRFISYSLHLIIITKRVSTNEQTRSRKIHEWKFSIFCMLTISLVFAKKKKKITLNCVKVNHVVEVEAQLQIQIHTNIYTCKNFRIVRWIYNPRKKYPHYRWVQ